MSKLYLITGFLGAGKTTFLKEFVQLFSAQKVAILINEFGKVNIDSALIADLNATLAEVHGGSVFCACRLEQFEKGLASLAAEHPDVILVETSGLSDPTNIDSILSNKDKYSEISYMGCICLADAVNFLKVIQTAKVSRKQLDVCDCVVINKTDLVTEEQLGAVMKTVQELRATVPIYTTTHGKIEREWVEALAFCHQNNRVAVHTKDVSLHSKTIIINPEATKGELEKILNLISPAAYRIKGFVEADGKIYLADCVGAQISLTPWSKNAEAVGCLVILSGAGLPTDKALLQAEKEFGRVVSLNKE